MNINIELKELGINHNCYGNEEFDYLGLLESNSNLKICTFIDDIKYVKDIPDHIEIIITTEAIRPLIESKGVCTVENPRITFFMLHNKIAKKSKKEDDIKTSIGENCEISKLAYISPVNVKIGNNVIIEEFVSIKTNTIIGDNVIIRAGTIVGGEGFEHKRTQSRPLSIIHIGKVIIEDDVELQQLNTVDKAIFPWDETIIGKGTKTDNQVHIAHASKLGENVFVAASSCIAGRVIIEDNVWIGPGVTIINGIKIGKNSKVSIGSVVSKSVDENKTVAGNFAIEKDKFILDLKKKA